MATKKDKSEEIEELENEEIEETEEVSEELPAPPKKATAKKEKINIMDASDSAEPPKKAAKKQFENKLDFTPVIDAINGLGEKMTPKKKKEENKSDEGFTDILGKW